jgi:type VII secretion-associated protein (TIGR03931 family)
VRAHIIEVGPTAIRRLCCGGATVVDAEAESAAFEHIDDLLTLIDLRPVTVESLWRSLLATVDCGTTNEVIVVHPSWWALERADVVDAAAHVLVGDVVLRPRSWLLSQASQAKSESATLIVEIADGLIAVAGTGLAAETRHGDQHAVVAAVVRSILAMVSDRTVIIDAPRTVHGARGLSALIAAKLRDSGHSIDVLEVDDLGLRRLAGSVVSIDGGERDARPQAFSWNLRRGVRVFAPLLLVITVALGVGAVIAHAPTRKHEDGIQATYIVEGHVAVRVPAQWPMRRVVTGPGSARVQITSPSDPDVALHVTQSRVALPSLEATAEFLRSAIDAAPAGVFVDFDPTGRSSGRPVATYREIRPGHDIRWTVWVENAVRISIGCQSRQGHDDAVKEACEMAVQSARAVD